MSKNTRRVKSPSKFISLEKLEDLLLNNCIGESGQEYHQSEIESLILQKRTKKDSEICLDPEDDEDGYQLYLNRIHKQRLKEYHHEIDKLWLERLTTSF